MLTHSTKSQFQSEKRRNIKDSFERFNPFSLIRDACAQIDHVDENMMTDCIQNVWFLHLDVIEESDRISIMADLPGVDFEQIKITLENEIIVTLTGERNLAKSNTFEHVHMSERFTGGFYRRFILPTYVDSKAIQMNECRGVLTIHLPKKFTDG